MKMRIINAPIRSLGPGTDHAALQLSADRRLLHLRTRSKGSTVTYHDVSGVRRAAGAGTA